MHSTVQPEFAHNSESVEVFVVGLLQHRSNVVRFADFVQQNNKFVRKIIFKLQDSQFGQRKVLLDLLANVQNRGSDEERIDVAYEDAIHLVRLFNQFLNVGDKHINVLKLDLKNELFDHCKFLIHEKSGILQRF